MSKQQAKRRVEDFGTEFEEKVLYINRCSKVVKGGRKFSFSALSDRRRWTRAYRFWVCKSERSLRCDPQRHGSRTKKCHSL